MTQSAAFLEHTGQGLTTLCQAWVITRRDGVSHGFTDHDRDLTFEGVKFCARTGLTASGLVQSTGLAIDNTEALGALTDASVSEADIDAGRFDGAEVKAWRVNWADPQVRWLMFRGHIGEIKRAGGAFQAELRGLTEILNRQLGRVYQKPCTAVLGDGQCRFDLQTRGYFTQTHVEQIEDQRIFRWAELPGFDEHWFRRGRLTLHGGNAEGLWGMIKEDRTHNGMREIELWEPIRAHVASGDAVHLSAGCDRRTQTCRYKFNNLINYQGFPDIPGEDWQMKYPSQTGVNTGGSLR